MLTKTQLKIMQVFVAGITNQYTVTDVSKATGLDYKSAYIGVLGLAKEGFLRKEHTLYSLDYNKHHQKLCYVEYLRVEEFFKKKKNRLIRLFVEDVIKQLEIDSFVLAIFGSVVDSKVYPRDIDILVIVDSQERVESVEKTMHAISSLSPLKLDIQVLSHDSVYELLAHRKHTNLINEILNKHLIVHGAETLYRLVAKGRP